MKKKEEEEEEERDNGTSGSEQCAIGLFGSRQSGLGAAFLPDCGVRSFAQDPSQNPPPSLHRQHRPSPPTRGTLVGSLDPSQSMRSDGQLCPALGTVSASRPLERMDRASLEVPDHQWQIPSSHQQQQLRRLCPAVPESQSPWTPHARIFE